MTRAQWEDCKVCGGDHWTKDHPRDPAVPVRALEQAEADYAEESRRFGPPFEGGFREGARWALNRWRAALDEDKERDDVDVHRDCYDDTGQPMRRNPQASDSPEKP